MRAGVRNYFEATIPPGLREVEGCGLAVLRNDLTTYIIGAEFHRDSSLTQNYQRSVCHAYFLTTISTSCSVSLSSMERQAQ